MARDVEEVKEMMKEWKEKRGGKLHFWELEKRGLIWRRRKFYEATSETQGCFWRRQSFSAKKEW